MKFCVAKRTHVLLGRAKFHVNLCNESFLCRFWHPACNYYHKQNRTHPWCSRTFTSNASFCCSNYVLCAILHGHHCNHSSTFFRANLVTCLGTIYPMYSIKCFFQIIKRSTKAEYSFRLCSNISLASFLGRYPNCTVSVFTFSPVLHSNMRSNTFIACSSRIIPLLWPTFHWIYFSFVNW